MAGPRESRRTAIAMMSMTGLNRTMANADTMMSAVRLMAIVEGGVPQVPYSITGSSAMWLRRTAVPSIARIGGVTLSFTSAERQTETTRASVASSSSGTARMTRSTSASSTKTRRSSLFSCSTSCRSEPLVLTLGSTTER